MKKIKYILFLVGIVTSGFIVSCESDEEKYSGTPVGNQNIETIHGTIEIDPAITSVVTSQKIPFTVKLPFAFQDSVVVEVTTLNKSGGRTRVSVDFVPGVTEVSEEIPAAGGALFDTTMDVYLSGIALKHAIPGKHYLIDSNVITLNTGNTTVPSDDNSRLQIKFSWYNPSTTRNNFRVFVDRPNANHAILSAGASYANLGTNPSPIHTVTVSSTAGLQVGMGVQVSSGQGVFPLNAMVLSVTPTTFVVNQAPTAALGANTVITGSGNDVILNGASSSGTTITLSQAGGSTTAGLVAGMPVSVISGAGKFRAQTVINTIVDDRTFTVTLSTTGGGASALNDATIGVSEPDVIPSFSGGVVVHDLINARGKISVGTSTAQGTYIFKLIPASILESGADVRYRIVWKRPDGTSGFSEGVFEAATVDSPAKEVLQVTKTGDGPSAVYNILPL